MWMTQTMRRVSIFFFIIKFSKPIYSSHFHFIFHSLHSQIHTNTEYDPDFSTDSYGLSDLEPSPHRPSVAAAATSGSATKRKRTKARAQKLPTTKVCEEFAPGRTNYSYPESIVLTRCWIDVSEDPVYANNQKVIAHWERIAKKYNAAKPAYTYKRRREQLRKHWDKKKK